MVPRKNPSSLCLDEGFLNLKDFALKGSDYMFELGGVLFIISGFIVFGSDLYFKKGKIKTLKGLLKIKIFGLFLSILGALLMFYGK